MPGNVFPPIYSDLVIRNSCTRHPALTDVVSGGPVHRRCLADYLLGWVFAAEHARRGRTGFAVGMLTAGLSFGTLLGSLVAFYINSAFGQAEINGGLWRFPFLLVMWRLRSSFSS